MLAEHPKGWQEKGECSLTNTCLFARLPACSTSEIPQEMLDDLISDLRPRFMPEHYNLLFHNCNTFSNELAQLLTGEGLPVSVRLVHTYPPGACISPWCIHTPLLFIGVRQSWVGWFFGREHMLIFSLACFLLPAPLPEACSCHISPVETQQLHAVPMSPAPVDNMPWHDATHSTQHLNASASLCYIVVGHSEPVHVIFLQCIHSTALLFLLHKHHRTT